MKVTITHQEIRQAFKLPSDCVIEITGAIQREVKERAPRRPSKKFKTWSPEDVALLKANSNESGKTLSKMLGRSVGAIAVKKSELRKQGMSQLMNSALNYTA